MKIISKLKVATPQGVAEGHWHEPQGVRSTVHDEPRPGVIRKLSLGDAGLLMQRGQFHAGITLAALSEILVSIEPDLKCPPKPKMTSDDLPLQRAAGILPAE